MSTVNNTSLLMKAVFNPLFLVTTIIVIQNNAESKPKTKNEINFI